MKIYEIYVLLPHLHTPSALSLICYCLAVQPVDNQSQGLKIRLGLIYKQPRVISIRAGTPSHLHL